MPKDNRILQEKKKKKTITEQQQVKSLCRKESKNSANKP